MRVILVGFPGSGKSSVGKKLAAKLGCDFVDLDDALGSLPCFYSRFLCEIQ